MAIPVYRLGKRLIFPDPRQADAEGLVAYGGDLSPQRLLLAYSQGIFPWPYNAYTPLLWFSPDPRTVLPPAASTTADAAIRPLPRPAMCASTAAIRPSASSKPSAVAPSATRTPSPSSARRCSTGAAVSSRTGTTRPRYRSPVNTTNGQLTSVTLGDPPQAWTDAGFHVDIGDLVTLGSTVVHLTGSGAGFEVNGTNAQARACLGSRPLRFQNSLFFNNGTGGTVQVSNNSWGAACQPNSLAYYNNIGAPEFALLPATGNVAGPDPGITTAPYPSGVTVPSYVPGTAIADLSAPDCALVNPDVFTTAAYKGAFQPGGGSAAKWMVSCPAPAAGQCNFVTFDVN